MEGAVVQGVRGWQEQAGRVGQAWGMMLVNVVLARCRMAKRGYVEAVRQRWAGAAVATKATAGKAAEQPAAAEKAPERPRLRMGAPAPAPKGTGTRGDEQADSGAGVGGGIASASASTGAMDVDEAGGEEG